MSSNGTIAEKLSRPQQWSIIGLLAAVVLWQQWSAAGQREADRLQRKEDREATVKAIDNQTSAIEKGNQVNGALLLEMTRQTERGSKGVEQILREFDSLPEQVVNELQRRK